MMYCNGRLIDFKSFPNKETYLDFDLVYEKNYLIAFKYEGDHSLMELFFLTKELKRTGSPITLAISYMPYSRMDRRVGNRMFTLKYVADFINSLKFDIVLVAEPHSDVTCALLNNSMKVPIVSRVLDYALRSRVVDYDPQVDMLFFPDAGAQKNFTDIFGENIGIGLKHRDFKTGRIIKYDAILPQGYDLTGKNVLIVDDLCSKGGTFMMSGKELRKYNPNKIFLITAHTEHTIFDGDLLLSGVVDMVVTTDSIIEKSAARSSERLMVVGWDYFIPSV